MGNRQRAGTELFDGIDNQIVDDVGHNRVKSGGRFVEKDDFRPGGHRARQPYPFLHTAGKFGRRKVGHVRTKSYLTQHFNRFFPRLPTRHFLIFKQAESNVFPYAQTVKQSPALKQHAHFGIMFFVFLAGGADGFKSVNFD